MDKVLALLSQTSDGAFAVDQAQRIVFWNGAAEALMGYSAEEVRGRFCYEVFGGKPRSGCLQCSLDCPVILAARRGEIIPSYNILTQSKNSLTILLNISVVLPAPPGGPMATIHLFRDVTHQLCYETYVEQLLRAASRLPLPQTIPDREALGHKPLTAPLTVREKEVLYFLIQGKAPREIATILSLSYATVRNYLQNMLRKLGVHSQREVVKLAHEQGLV